MSSPLEEGDVQHGRSAVSRRDLARVWQSPHLCRLAPVHRPSQDPLSATSTPRRFGCPAESNSASKFASSHRVVPEPRGSPARVHQSQGCDPHAQHCRLEPVRWLIQYQCPVADMPRCSVRPIESSCLPSSASTRHATLEPCSKPAKAGPVVWIHSPAGLVATRSIAGAERRAHQSRSMPPAVMMIVAPNMM